MVMKSLNHCYYAANEINFHHIATEHCNVPSTLQIIWLGCAHGNIDETKTERARQRESFNCNLNLERARIKPTNAPTQQQHQLCNGNCDFFFFRFQTSTENSSGSNGTKGKRMMRIKRWGKTKRHTTEKNEKQFKNRCSADDEKAHVQRHTLACIYVGLVERKA